MRTVGLLAAVGACAGLIEAFMLPPAPKSFAVSRARQSAVPMRVIVSKDGSGREEERKRTLEELLQDDNSKLDGYKLYDMIVAKWGVPYFLEFRRVDFGRTHLHLNVMWMHQGQPGFPLKRQEYLEHLQYITDKLKQWDQVTDFKEAVRKSNKKPNSYFGYAVPINIKISEQQIQEFVSEVQGM